MHISLKFLSILCLGFSLSACGKKGKLENPTPQNPYPRIYPSLPKSFNKKDWQENSLEKSINKKIKQKQTQKLQS